MDTQVKGTCHHVHRQRVSSSDPEICVDCGFVFFGTPHDPIDHPTHYTKHPSGVECIQITEYMNFNKGNALKYVWRAGEKGDEVEDLKKARWYIDREIARISK